MLKERGDTLVEVLVAVAVMAAITVGVLGVLNRGIGEALNASERVAVRSLVSDQIELLNYVRDAYVQAEPNDRNAYPASLWTAIRNLGGPGAPNIRSVSDCTDGNRAFYIEYDNTTTRYEVRDFNGSAVASAIPGPNNGLWIDPKKFDSTSVPGAGVSYVDLSVKACWRPVSGSVDQNLSSVVRLYDTD